MQEYKMVVRTIWTGEDVFVGKELHVQNAAKFQDYLNEVYLKAGYRILSVDYLGEVIVNEFEQSNSPKALRYTYHMVRDVETAKKDVK